LLLWIIFIVLSTIFQIFFYLKYFQQILGVIAHNVPAVYDILPARIRALRSKDQGWQNVGEVSRGKEAIGRLT
jgi:hypothetical protein